MPVRALAVRQRAMINKNVHVVTCMLIYQEKTMVKHPSTYRMCPPQPPPPPTHTHTYRRSHPRSLYITFSPEIWRGACRGGGEGGGGIECDTEPEGNRGGGGVSDRRAGWHRRHRQSYQGTACMIYVCMHAILYKYYVIYLSIYLHVYTSISISMYILLGGLDEWGLRQ